LDRLWFHPLAPAELPPNWPDKADTPVDSLAFLLQGYISPKASLSFSFPAQLFILHHLSFPFQEHGLSLLFDDPTLDFFFRGLVFVPFPSTP